MAFGRLGAVGAGFGHLGASPGGGVSAPTGGAALLVGETAGFAADFTYATDASRVAVKVAGTVTSSGLSFFTNAGTSSKWVYDISGTLVNVAAGSLAVDYDPVTHVARGLWSEPAATNLLLNNATLSTQSVTVTATAYTLSIFGTGTVTLTGTSTAGPLAGTGAANRVSLTFTPTAGSLTLTVSGSVTKAQLETGTIASSPIPTLGASVTRAADNISITPASINYSATAGSWWVDLGLTAFLAGGRVIAYSSTLVPFYTSASNFFTLYDGASNISTLVTNVVGNNKVALAFASADRAITANGIAPTTDALAGIAFGSPGSAISFMRDNTGNPCVGYIRKLRYLPRRPTNVELQSMTA
jgi:hypothetical protein